jgi:hypothetical protein
MEWRKVSEVPSGNSVLVMLVEGGLDLKPKRKTLMERTASIWCLLSRSVEIQELKSFSVNIAIIFRVRESVAAKSDNLPLNTFDLLSSVEVVIIIIIIIIINSKSKFAQHECVRGSGV